jgi:hypothetical protein
VLSMGRRLLLSKVVDYDIYCLIPPVLGKIRCLIECTWEGKVHVTGI